MTMWKVRSGSDTGTSGQGDAEDHVKLAGRRLPFAQLPDWAEYWIAYGTQSYPRHVRRRLRIMNMVAYVIALFTLVYAIQYAALGLTAYWLMVVINLVIVIIALAVPFCHRVNELLGGILLLTAEFVALFLITALLGQLSGVHLQYFASAPATFVVFGVERARLAIGVVVVGLALHILAWAYLPAYIGMLDVDIPVLLSSYVTAAAATMGVIAITVFYAFSAAEKARDQADQLLANALPVSVVERLKDDPDVRIADRHNEATVLFADLVGFTPLSRKLEPEALVTLLNAIVLAVDQAAARHGIEKIKTIGDSYMALAGAPVPQADHAVRMADFALEIRTLIPDAARAEGHEIAVRVGLASGPVLAGIIGAQKFSYDVWGDTVNVAARMESTARNGTIQVNAALHDALTETHVLADQGTHEVKGLGPTATWELVERKPQ